MHFDLGCVDERYYGISNGIRKSFKDKNEYKILTLDNGLKVFIAVKTGSLVSSAAMNVSVGSDSDPINKPGLAHFLEHMLFMGSKKYPNENEFSGFVTQNGGTQNAFTANNFTCYHFGITHCLFSRALDIFAGFFVDPLFNHDAVLREVKAIDSEHKKNIRDDSWRMLQALKNSTNPKHPYSRFQTGDLSTLLPENNGQYQDELRSALLEFYQQHYTSEAMTLFILHHDMDEAVELATRLFASVPRRAIDSVNYDCPLIEPLTNRLKTVTHQSISDTPRLSIAFEIPTVEHNILSLFKHLMTELGESTLIDYLRSKDYVYSMHVDSAVSFDTTALLTIDFALSAVGASHIQDICQSMDKYVTTLISSENREIVKTKYQEVLRMARKSFLEASLPEPSEFLQSLICTMHDYTLPLDQLLTFYVEEQSFDTVYQSLVELCQSVRLHHGLVILSVPHVSGDNLKWDPYYQMQYTLGVLEISGDISCDYKFSIAPPNKRIPTTLDIDDNASSDNEIIEMVNTGYCRVYHDRDNSFKTANQIAMIRFVFPEIYSPERVVLSGLYVGALREQFKDRMGQLNMGNNVSFTLQGDRLDVTIASSELDVFTDCLDLLFSCMKPGFRFNPEAVQKAYQGDVKIFNNLGKRAPIERLANTMYRHILADKFVPIEDAEQFLKSFDISESDRILNVMRTLFQCCHVLVVFGGMTDQHTAQTVYQKISENTSICPCMSVKHINRDLDYIEHSCHLDDPNSAARYMVELDLIEDGVTVDWEYKHLCAMMLNNVMSHMYFDLLRTKMQLGYIVGSHVEPINRCEREKHLYMVFDVQSPVADCRFIKQKTEEFIEGVQTYIIGMPDEAFLDMKISLKNFLLEGDTNVNDRMMRLLGNLASSGNRKPMFDKRERMLAAIDQLDQKYFVDYFLQRFIKARKMMFVGIDASKN